MLQPQIQRQVIEKVQMRFCAWTGSKFDRQTGKLGYEEFV